MAGSSLGKDTSNLDIFRGCPQSLSRLIPEFKKKKAVVPETL